MCGDRRRLRAARDRNGPREAPVAGADVRFVLGDVTHLPAYVDDHYTFALDVGCFHGLTDEGRVAYGRGLTAVTAPGARLLMFAFSPGRRGPLPRGSSRRDVEQALAGWEVVGDDAMDTGSAPGLLARPNHGSSAWSATDGAAHHIVDVVGRSESIRQASTVRSAASCAAM